MGGPELGYTAQAATAISHRYGMPCDVYGLSSDSRVIDVQCGFERAIGALLASMARPDFVSGMGLMQTAVGGSLEMLVIDDEISRWIRWSLEERPADEAVLDVAEMERGALSDAGFLGLRQTRELPPHREGAEQALVPGHAGELDRRACSSARAEGRRGAGAGAGGARRGLLTQAGEVIAETARQMDLDDARTCDAARRCSR